MEAISQLSKLPTASSGAPDIPENTVRLFLDDNWRSRFYNVDITQYERGVRHRVPESWNDAATWLVYRLPIGRVVTLTQHHKQDFPNNNVADLSDCGTCVDLVGTGQLETVDLGAVALNDAVTGFFWRDVDFRVGAIELFRDVNFQGGRTIIFLSEWEQGVVHSLERWWVQDQISSLRWYAMRDRETARLFDNVDAAGDRLYLNSWERRKENENLIDWSMNDRVSAFQWEALVPEKEYIYPFPVDDPINTSAADLASVMQEGRNTSDKEEEKNFYFERDVEKQLTVSTTDSRVSGIETSWSQEASVGVEDVATVKASWTLTLSYQYSHTVNKAVSDTRSVKVPINDKLVVKPHHAWKWSAQVFVGWLPRKQYKTKADRWYKEELTGSVRDGNLWKRVEEVYVNIEGSIAAHVIYDSKQTPL